jgi:hypothetical protein
VFKRIESWAAHSPERTKLLIVLTCLALSFLVVGFIFVLAWLMLDWS